VTGDASIRRLNGEYRHKRGATDILSFAYHTGLAAPEAFPPGVRDDPEQRILGDMVISAPYVQRWCVREHARLVAAASAAAATGAAGANGSGSGVPQLADVVNERWRTLLVHGVVHLLGYDHESEAQHAAMARREADVAAALQMAAEAEPLPAIVQLSQGSG
jgi:ssRNA-specific RNase YbeY (16S rRNA maturation enzyme)